MKVWYRRTGKPYAFPVTSPDDVEVAFVEQQTGPCDGDWNESAIDDDFPDAEIVEKNNCPEVIADALYCEIAIYRAAGIKLPLNGDGFDPWTPEYLEVSRVSGVEELCDAVELMYGHDIGRLQRIILREVVSPEYAASHLDDCE